MLAAILNAHVKDKGWVFLWLLPKPYTGGDLWYEIHITLDAISNLSGYKCLLYSKPLSQLHLVGAVQGNINLQESVVVRLNIVLKILWYRCVSGILIGNYLGCAPPPTMDYVPNRGHCCPTKKNQFFITFHYCYSNSAKVTEAIVVVFVFTSQIVHSRWNIKA